MIDEESEGSPHTIGALEVKQAATVKVDTTLRLDYLLLESDARLENNEYLTVQTFVWRSGTIVGQEKQVDASSGVFAKP